MPTKRATSRRRSSHKHEISGAFQSGGLWYVKCSCKWMSKGFGYPGFAEDAGDQHKQTLEGK